MSDIAGPIPIAPTVADKDLSACGYDLRRYDTCCTGAQVDFEASIGERTLARTVKTLWGPEEAKRSLSRTPNAV